MKIVVIGHGMVGHKFVEAVQDAPDVAVTVLCEEPRPAYDRVHLSEFFAGKTAEDLSLVTPGFFDRSHLDLRINTRAVSVDRVAKTVLLADGSFVAYEKLVFATGSYPFVPPLQARIGATASCIAPSKTWKRCANAARARQPVLSSAAVCSVSNAPRRCATWAWKPMSSNLHRA